MQTKPVVSRAKAYLKVRHKSIRDAMKELKLDGFLLTHPPDLAYLTNFTGDDSIGLITEKDFFLVTDFRYQEQAELEAGWLKIERPRREDVGRAGQDARRREGEPGRVRGQLHRVRADPRDRQVGEGAEGTRPDGTLELVPVENVLTNIRKVKDDHEIDLVRKSVGVAEEAFEADPRARSRSGRRRTTSPGCSCSSCGRAGRATAASR